MNVVVVNVDDDHVTLMLHNIIVKATGLDLRVENFSCGEDVLGYLRAFKDLKNTKFLMLLDINMPGLSGWDVLNELSSINELNIHVALVTSSIDTRDQKKSKMYDIVYDFFVKPINKDRLLDFFQKALGLNQQL